MGSGEGREPDEPHHLITMWGGGNAMWMQWRDDRDDCNDRDDAVSSGEAGCVGGWVSGWMFWRGDRDDRDDRDDRYPLGRELGERAWRS